MDHDELEFLMDFDPLLKRMRENFEEIEEWLILGRNKAEAWDRGREVGRKEGRIEGLRGLLQAILSQKITLSENEVHWISLLEEEEIYSFIPALAFVENKTDLKRQLEKLAGQRMFKPKPEKPEVKMKENRAEFLDSTSFAIARLRTQFDKIDEQRWMEREREEAWNNGWEEGQRTLIKTLLSQRMTLSEQDEDRIDMLSEEEIFDLIDILFHIDCAEEQRRQIDRLLQMKIRS